MVLTKARWCTGSRSGCRECSPVAPPRSCDYLEIRPTTDLRASVVCDGDEQTPSGPFRVTLDLVRDTLGSQLFSSRGDSRRAFGHSSHAALLAARYLRRRHLPQRQLEGLFLVAGPDGSRSVPVPLR